MSEGQITEFVEDDEVHPGQLIREPTVPPIAGLGLEPVDEIDDVVEPATGSCSDAASGDSNGKMSLTGSGAADEHHIALLGDEATAGEVIDERLIDRSTVEFEVAEIFGERKLGNGELVLD